MSGPTVPALREFDPEAGSCPCASGEFKGVPFETYCWRTGPQKEGVGIWVRGDEQTDALRYLLASAVSLGWPGMSYEFFGGDEPPFRR